MRTLRGIGVTVLGVVSVVASGQTFDAVADFSASSNPTGPWWYGLHPLSGLLAGWIWHRFRTWQPTECVAWSRSVFLPGVRATIGMNVKDLSFTFEGVWRG